LLWRWKSRPGRPPIPLELRQLIRRMAAHNPPWGEERIANELLVKLGLRVSPRTVHMSLGPGVPGPPVPELVVKPQNSRHRLDAGPRVQVASVLGGLHHEYSLATAPA